MMHSSPEPWRILLVDKNKEDYLITRNLLSQAQGRKVFLEWAPTCQAGKLLIHSANYDAVLVEYDLDLGSGIDLIRETAAGGNPAPLILYTAHNSYQVDVEAMEAGASLYLTKGDANPLSLERFIRSAIERKQTELELEHRLQDRSTILESIQDGLFGIDWNWNITYINSRAAANSGFEPGELAGKNIWETFPRLNGSVLETNYRRVMAERIPTKFEMRGAYQNLWYSISVYPSAEGISIYWQDITERKRAEIAKREIEEDFRILADSSPSLIWMTDAEGASVFVNRAYKDFFGVTQEQVQGNGWQPLVHPDDAPRYVKEFFRAVQKQVLFKAEARVLHADGEWRSIRSYGVPRFSADGKFLGLVGNSLDITGRKQIEQELESALSDIVNEKNRLMAVMEALPVGVAIIDKNGGVTLANSQYEEMWGSPRPDTQSVDDYDAYKAWWVDTGSPLQPDQWASARAVQKGETVLGQYLKIQRFDGTYGYILNSGAPIRDDQGQITGCAVAIMDITEQKRLEIEEREHLVQMEIQRHLQDFREQKRQAMARELHDGPVQDLSSLLFHVQFTKEVITDQAVKAEIDQIAEGLKRTIQNLREMMNELRPPSLIRFGLAKAIRIQLEEFQEKFPEIELDICLDDEDCILPEPVRLNLYRIFQEALINTTKHSQAKKIVVRLNCIDHLLALEVRDDGQGFSLSNNLADYSILGHYGLVGMKERADAIGAKLEISSGPGKGTSIQVKVPVPDSVGIGSAA